MRLASIAGQIKQLTLLLLSIAAPSICRAETMKPLLVLDGQLIALLGSRMPSNFDVVSIHDVTRERVLKHVADGNGLVWIGPLENLPPELWTGSFRPASSPLSISVAPGATLPLSELNFRKAMVSSIYIKPAKELPVHNVDEEPRSDLIPILTASDRFDRVIGYPAALMRYYSPSLAGHRFGGSDCFYFAFDDPVSAINQDGWVKLMKKLAEHFQSRLQLTRMETGFTSYRSGERVQVRVQVRNKREHAAAVELHLLLKKPGETKFHEYAVDRRVPDGNSETELLTDFVAGNEEGLWTIRVEAWQDLQHAEEPGIEGNPIPIDRRDIGVVVVGPSLKTSQIVQVQGRDISIDGKTGFWTGTNYYPSSSWWEWLWRDFRPLQVQEDFAAMRRTGYRLVRIWVDPNLDEESLRSMDAAIYLAAQEGIVLDVCVFTQWVRSLSFENAEGQHVRFHYRDTRDFNIYGISLRNISLQKEYLATLGARWKSVGNIIYDLANETYIKDPTDDQVDLELTKHYSIPAQKGTLRDTTLFRVWAQEMTSALREAGGSQIAMAGYMFSTLDGGDNYLGNRDVAIEPWHSYSSFELTAATTAYEDPACSRRPMLLEEFGIAGWNSTAHYDAMAHAALAAGATGAMSYEWGVRWLAHEFSFESLPLRDVLSAPPDPRFFGPARDFVKGWHSQSTGIYESPSGLTYGSVYTGTPFPASAAVVLGRLGQMGTGMDRQQKESLYVVVPSAPTSTAEAMKKTEQVIRQFMSNHIAFGVLQEDCLGTIPKSTRTLIVPVPLTGDAGKHLAKAQVDGISVIDGSDPELLSSSRIEKIPVTPANANLMVRDVDDGYLYLLESQTPTSSASITLAHQVEMQFGLSGYAAVRQRNNAIDWIEASGEIRKDGNVLLSVDKGRVIVATVNGEDIATAGRIRILASEPTLIYFPKKITSIATLDGEQSQPSRVELPKEDTVLKIDDEMVPYVIEIRF